MICGERWCYANFKMGPAISVGSQKVEKYEFDQIKKKIKFRRRLDLNRGPTAL